MNKKNKAIIAIGGTGGHVFPGCNLANHLNTKNYDVELVTDKRGRIYLKEFKVCKISNLPSSPLINKNIFTKSVSVIVIIYSIIRAIFFLLLNRPKVIFGMGGYASFPICIAASILKIDFIIYENNLIIGKANKFLLPFAKKIIVSFKEVEGISNKYQNKIIEIGNIIKKEIINFPKKKEPLKKNGSNFNILILGGSQAAKIFAEKLPQIFKLCSEQGIKLKLYQHCLPNQNDTLKLFYQSSNIDYEIFNFSNKLENYFSKVNLAITRSGSSILAELTNANVPFITVPLPSSADNHQLKNAIYYKEKNLSYLIEEKDLNTKLFSFINEIYRDNSILDKILLNQRQYSDKNVYNNVDQLLKDIIHEEN